MGQYYKAVTMQELEDMSSLNVYSLQSKEFRETCNYDFYQGIKLMEHSWIGNRFTDFFSHLIHKNPLVVAWVGDYAGGEVPRGFFEAVYPEDSDGTYLDYENPHGKFNYTGKFLVNHTKKEYFPFPEYDDNKWEVYPVSLLTAIGNGRGGGDYHTNNPDAHLVGSWALDTISIEDSALEGYKEIPVPGFKE